MRVVSRYRMLLSKFGKLGGARKHLSAAAYHPYNASDWDGVDPADCAKDVISRSVGTRKSDQQFNFFGVVGSVGIIVVVLWVWIYLIGGGTRHGLTASQMYATRLVEEGGGSYGVGTSISGLHIDPTNTPTMIPDTPTATFTVVYTSTFEPTATLGGREVQFQYSYYNPALGGVNCANWDEVAGKCVSMMSDGNDWRNYYNVAVACPIWYPLGTSIVVDAPKEVAGLWVCMDYCPVCNENDIIDFLQLGQALPWRAMIYARVYFPGEQ